MTPAELRRSAERIKPAYENLALADASPLTPAEIAERDTRWAEEDAIRADVRKHYSGAGMTLADFKDWYRRV